jgi:putative ABC transport system permease protein
MLLGEILRVAFSAIQSNKLRSFLTTLGIVIGIAAVIAMIALGQGAQKNVQDRLASMGTNILTVRPGQQFFGGVDRGDRKMTNDDADALAANPQHILRLSPVMQSHLQVTYLNGNASTQVIGVWPTYFPINDGRLDAGRLFTMGEERGRRRVAVLGSDVGPMLKRGSTNELIGQTIQIKGVPFEVIGTLVSKGSQGWEDPDQTIYIPLSTAQFRLFGTDRIREIDVQAISAKDMDPATAEIDRVMRRAHKIEPGQPDDFTIRNQTTLITAFQDTAKTFSFLLAGIALVSLLVGGIGIMNIMLVSVTERTREIGIRKALGARRRDILLQFLTEALTLCLAGGVLGSSVGILSAYLMQRMAGWNTSIAPAAVGLAFLFAGIVGIFFGIWPARRAASLDPIIALRYE